jgi:hypothetical protein
MFQAFYLGVAKPDLDDAYTYMLQGNVSSVSYICCKCFILLLHMFCNGYTCFLGILQVFQTYIASRPANGLGSNGFNELGFQMGALWMGGNGLIYLAGWVRLGLIENWVGWVGIGFFFGFEWVELMG